ncbi:LssY C-terminal domain-containing protein [Vibrio europaeus]|uniref:LssY-like C-terminal domain-containing protein n=1 Tax=Vibrio europaeus TaxID=300876 RepID=A0AAE7AWE3_9VIBR|nr:LssY C-terminal domain-containing protein [Vibrio europaeus]MDC5806884.1 LssY C-terminal domain-containing protein [Vibrio europaeus]MDC5809481.1 LssY C-terminal domain-containing protein [Vibrio europaeus]MDC5821623.1 LssY C-terminal domain-containing protein [Vibrio europaeus]MDC5827409.1 LssY C-terminal domain-containing protein [Vibrio europaeus]MDC5830253.1 LssY C-terminal domain-containing protein [Vibrio europaeus]
MFEGFSLFVGALLDALIGPNLFVPGEPFLLAAGYQLQQGIITGVIAVLLGGFIGDQVSYLIGQRLGNPAQKKLIRWQPKTRRPIARCRHLMAKKGNYVLAFARLLGPIAWVVPFIAGSQKISWARFSLYSSIGLFLGVGQFVAWGYLLGYGIDNFPILNEAKVFLVEHKAILIAIGASVGFYLIGRKLRWRLMFTKFTAFLLASVLYANYAHFFFYSDDFATKEGVSEQKAGNELVTISELPLKAYPGKSAVFDAQVINVAYVGEDPRTLMAELGWIENKTFSRNDLEISDYVELLKLNTPPVSDLFWNGVPQELAFQLPGNLLKRSHIRWWQAGVDSNTSQNLWVGALSYDDGLQITPYSGIVTILHSIDPNVDLERDKLAEQVISTTADVSIDMAAYHPPTILDGEHDYYTDGRVLVIKSELASRSEI